MDDLRKWRKIAGVMLLVAALPIPVYAYYTFLRIFVCLTCILVFIQVRRDKNRLPVMYIILAILFNPIVPILLPKEVWMPIDIIAGLIMLVGGKKDN
jgi:hypothetical protein